MTINNLSCRMCLVECSDTERPFWHYEYLLNQYDDFLAITNPLPSKICSDCCGNIATLVTFRDRIRSTEQQVEISGLDLSLSCRICMTECKKSDIKASDIPVVLRHCTALSELDPTQGFWGRICGECVEDLKVLGYYIRKYREVQKILQLEEFDQGFIHSNIVDPQKLLTKCRKILAEYRIKMGDERLIQELSFLSYLLPKRHTFSENAIPITPSLLFGIESTELLMEIRSPAIKSDIKLETLQEQDCLEDVISLEEAVPSLEIFKSEDDFTEEIPDPIEPSPKKFSDKRKIQSVDVQVLPNKSKKSIRKPLNSHSNAKLPIETAKYICDTCGYYFHSKYKLNYHKRKHNKDLWMYCDLCPGRSFENKTYLTKHMKRLHLPRQMITCKECGQQFKDHASRHYHHLSKHVDSSKWKFTCPVCGKKWYSKFHLKDHVNTHTGEKTLTFPVLIY